MKILKVVGYLFTLIVTIAIFLIAFGALTPAFGEITLSTAPGTIGGKSTSGLVSNAYKLLIYAPLVAVGMGLYWGVMKILERERISRRY